MTTLTPEKLSLIAIAANELVQQVQATGSTSSFGGVTAKGQAITKPCQACHMALNYLGHYDPYSKKKAPEGKIQVLYSWAKPPIKQSDPEVDEIFKRFNAWLVSEVSPYRSLWAHVTEPIFVPGIGDVTSDEFCRNYGYILSDMDAPANLIGNFFIMARQAREFYGMVRVWSWLVDNDIDPNLAMIWAHQLKGSLARDQQSPKTENFSDHQWLPSGAHDGHHPLNVWGSCTLAYVKNFVTGTVAEPNHAFSKSQDYTPCNGVWGRGPGWGEDKAYSDFCLKTYADLFGVMKVQTRFQRSWEEDDTKHKLTTPSLLKLLHLEQKRILPNASLKGLPVAA